MGKGKDKTIHIYVSGMGVNKDKIPSDLHGEIDRFKKKMHDATIKILDADDRIVASAKKAKGQTFQVDGSISAAYLDKDVMMVEVKFSLARNESLFIFLDGKGGVSTGKSAKARGNAIVAAIPHAVGSPCKMLVAQIRARG